MVSTLKDMGFPCSSVSKESACSARDPCSIPGSGKSPGEGKGYPGELLQILKDDVSHIHNLNFSSGHMIKDKKKKVEINLITYFKNTLGSEEMYHMHQPSQIQQILSISGYF